MIATKKYAVRFPGISVFEKKDSLSIFSEGRIIKTEETFFSVIDAASSIVGYVVQKKQTKELGKRIAIQKEALDAEINNKTEQLKIQFFEKAQRMKVQLETEKEQINIEFQSLKMELAEKSQEFGFSFEEYMRTNQVFYSIVLKEKNLLEKIHPYIDSLADAYSNRREYILYCELERKSLNLINEYMMQMV